MSVQRKIEVMKYLVVAVGCALLFCSVMVNAQKKKISVSPPDKSLVSEAEVLVMVGGEDVNQDSVDIKLNNVDLRDKVRYLGSMAYVALTLNKGENRLLVMNNGQVEKQLTYLFQENEPPPKGYTRFIFHDAFLNSGCGDCHDLEMKPFDYKNIVYSEEAISLCLECHDDRLQAKYIHGPVGAGICTPCHDPHGNERQFLLTRKGNSLCEICHEKERIQKHLTKLQETKAGSSTSCLDCHDPHGTEKKFHLK